MTDRDPFVPVQPPPMRPIWEEMWLYLKRFFLWLWPGPLPFAMWLCLIPDPHAFHAGFAVYIFVNGVDRVVDAIERKGQS